MAKYVKFMRGTTTAYNNLTEKDNDTLYFLSDSDHEEGALYLGTKLIAGPDAGVQPETLKLTDLLDVIVSSDVNYESLLMFNPKTKQWENYSFDALVFTGATNALDGLSGLVPAPSAGEQHLFLRGDGTWAAAGASHQTFEGIASADEAHSATIQKIIADKIVNNGDLIIIKDLLSEGKYQYTTYVYDNGVWRAMDGQYDAENVYFKSNLTFTEAVGTVTIPASGSAIVETAGKNVKQLMEMIFAKEKNPATTAPYVSLSTNHKAYEVGTKVTPSYEFSFNPGSYEFGPATGVTPSSYSITATNKLVTVETINSDTYPTTSPVKGTMDSEVEVQDDTNYYLTVTVGHGAGVTPKTNLDNDYSDGIIAAGTAARSSGALTGYRAFFYGMDASGAVLNSEFIRGNLINGGAYNGSKTLTFTASELEGVKRFLIAIPASSVRGGVTSATITSSMNADATSDYILLQDTVNVEGANGYSEVPYKIWVYEPASIASTEVHSVVLN